MTNRTVALALAALMATGTVALAQGNSQNAPGQDRVCLVTFSDATAAESGANAGVTSAKILPRKAAEAQENETTKIYEYGTQGELTQEACDCLDNPDTRESCDQPVFNG